MKIDKENLIEELLKCVEDILFLEEQYSDADVVDKLLKIVEEEYDI